jgi:hypothetical protein
MDGRAAATNGLAPFLIRPRALAAVLAFLCGFAVPAAAAPPLTAEQAIANEQAALRDRIHPPCRRGGAEIVVCGRSSDRERIPLPNERIAGDRTRLLPGEPPSAVAAMKEGDTPCSNVGPRPRCGFSISFIAVGIVALKLGRHLIDPDSDPPPPPISSESPPD